MIAPALAPDESDRLRELYKYELLDSRYEEEFDEIVQLASRICNVPISLITLVDVNRQWFKARKGLDIAETERSISFCGHAILSDDLFEVEDAVADNRFFDNPLVTDAPNIRFYAGMPLITVGGHKIGTLCVIDRIPRQLDEEQIFALNILSKNVMKLFDLRVKTREWNRITEVQKRIMTIMAHDIRGPLTSLQSLVAMKAEGALQADELAEFDTIAIRQIENTLLLLDNIVSWGKLQLAGDQLSDDPFNVYQLCVDCFNYYALAAKAKQNELVNGIDPSLEAGGSRAALEFVLRNLLGNAIKFTSSGVIKVDARIENEEVVLTVQDTGVGMSEAAIASVMNRTWASSTLGTKKEKGSGTGLKLVFEQIESLGGSILFENNKDRGTLVTVRMPRGF
jgi:signal transduction histidine kinase